MCSFLDHPWPQDESFHPLPITKGFSPAVLDPPFDDPSVDFTALQQKVTNFFRIDDSPKKTFIRGQIKQQANSTVRLKYFRQNNWLEFWKDTVLQLDRHGNFALDFSLDYPQKLSLAHAYKTMLLYLEPGDSLFITTDAQAFYRKASFAGSAKANQEFLLDFYRHMRGDTIFRSYDYQLLEQDQVDFFEKKLAKEKKELLFLQEKKSHLTPDFVSFMERDIRFHYAFFLWEAAYRFRRDKDLYLDPTFTFHVEQLRTILYRLPPQRNFDFGPENYVNWQLYRVDGISQGLNMSAKDANYFANLLLQSKETYVRHTAMKLFRSYTPAEGLPTNKKQWLADLLRICKDPELIESLSVFNRARAGSLLGPNMFRTIPVGKLAPEWTFKDAAGENISLSDFRGKKILLHLGWSPHLESALEDIATFRDNQAELPQVVHLVYAENDDEFAAAVLDREGLFIRVPNEEMQILQDSYHLENRSNHYFVLDENGIVVANNFDLGTPIKMRGTWQKVVKSSADKGWTAQERLHFWRNLGVGAIVLLLSSLVFLWQRRIAARKNLRQRQLLELELKGIRSQMNPHFLFNAMSSIQNLIRKKEGEKADLYLGQFAGLMRRTLRNTAEEFIPLSEELAMIEQYCHLEALRNPFVFEFAIDEDIDQENTYIPCMILQPIIENAIVHGLLPKKGDKQLWIRINWHAEGLDCTIIDNGIGIETAQAYAQSHPVKQKHFGVELVNQRLNLLTGEDTKHVLIQDRSSLKLGWQGTQVSFIIPTES